jgi:ketosteroid isomerase-like protein
MSRALPRLAIPVFATVALTFASYACGGGSGTEAPPAVDVAAEADILMELDREWGRRFAAEDLDWIVALHSDDAVLMAPGTESGYGHEAIRAGWEGMMSGMAGTTWEPTFARVAASGDLGYVYGTATGVFPDGSRVPMKFMEVWTKESGEWKVALDMFNANVQ